MTVVMSAASPPLDGGSLAAERILIYGMNYAPELTGVGRYTGEIGSYLHQRGVCVDVVTSVPHYPGWVPHGSYRNRYSVGQCNGVRVTRCPLLLRSRMYGLWRFFAPLSFAITSAPLVLWRAMAGRPNTVLCIEPTLFAAPVGLLAARMVGARSVLHVQDLEIDAAFAVGHLSSRILQAAAKWFERKVLSSFSEVVTISGRMREHLLAKGVKSTRLRMIRNWVDLDKIKPLARPVPLRRELGLPDDAFVVLYAGNVGRKQALTLVLDAASKLADRPQLNFVVSGEGPEKQTLVSKYGTLPNVRFLPLQPEERLCELLNVADAHVLPQHAGTADLVLPSKLGGMLASGKPCIVTADDKTELKEFLEGVAIITPAGDSDALAEAILRVARGASPFRVDAQLALAEQLCAKTNLAALALVLFQSAWTQTKSASAPATDTAYEI